MAEKSEKVGVVVSNKMQKSIVVAVEWQVRHGLYGKTERRTSKFMVHDEENAAKIGDTVAIIPGYSPGTVNWYDAFHVVDDEVVVDIWPVIPRGPGHHGLVTF